MIMCCCCSIWQTEIRKEVERRKMGKEMLDFKRKHEDDRTKRMLEERNREKAEEKAARDRVKQQIALVSTDTVAWFSPGPLLGHSGRLRTVYLFANLQTYKTVLRCNRLQSILNYISEVICTAQF